jgi:hypothetical protein
MTDAEVAQAYKDYAGPVYARAVRVFAIERPRAT